MHRSTPACMERLGACVLVRCLDPDCLTNRARLRRSETYFPCRVKDSDGGIQVRTRATPSCTETGCRLLLGWLRCKPAHRYSIHITTAPANGVPWLPVPCRSDSVAGDSVVANVSSDMLRLHQHFVIQGGQESQQLLHGARSRIELHG